MPNAKISAWTESTAHPADSDVFPHIINMTTTPAHRKIQWVHMRAALGAYSGWITPNQTWSYLTTSSITVPSGAASIYAIGDKITFYQSGYKYFYVVGITDTSLTLTGGSDYTVANAAITLPFYSKGSSLINFPQYFAYTPTGISATNVTLAGRFSIVARRCWVDMIISITGGITFTTSPTLPITASSNYKGGDISLGISGYGSYLDNGTAYVLGTIFPTVATSGTVCGIRLSNGNSISATSPITWANGDKIELHFSYEI